MPESPAPPRTLAGLRVLVTRPRDQAENLAQLIEARGGQAIRFPVIKIAEPSDPRALNTILERLEDFDMAIFISPNAVNRALPLIRARGGMPPNLQLACVGRGSARELARHDIETAIAPRDRFDSEALLELPALQAVKGKRIVIFRGEGGRELLGDTLKARGAQVEYAECYRRQRPDADTTPLRQRWERGEIDIVSVTSADGLRNLLDMVGPAGRERLLRTPIVVVSERMARVCHELGFKTEARVAATAGDEAMVDAIQAWRDG